MTRVDDTEVPDDAAMLRLDGRKYVVIGVKFPYPMGGL
jgi:hypothetical protein